MPTKLEPSNITNNSVELLYKFIERWKMLIWNPVFIWFQSFVFETAWLSFFQVTITWKTTKCANTCLNFRQKHDSQVVINFNQFHSPLESCQKWNLSPFKYARLRVQIQSSIQKYGWGFIYINKNLFKLFNIYISSFWAHFNFVFTSWYFMQDFYVHI